jgi:hypothetical protein
MAAMGGLRQTARQLFEIVGKKHKRAADDAAQQEQWPKRQQQCRNNQRTIRNNEPGNFLRAASPPPRITESQKGALITFCCLQIVADSAVRQGA